MAITTDALAGVFEADRTHSSVTFAVRHMTVSTFRAWFADVDARLIADASDLRLEGAARVESISIADPPEFREHVVRGADFFDADNHPEILFHSERVELAENGTAMVDGELTIKGLSRPITATGTYQRPVEDPYGSRRAALELRAVLDRRDWGMSWQQPLPDGTDAGRLTEGPAVSPAPRATALAHLRRQDVPPGAARPSDTAETRRPR